MIEEQPDLNEEIDTCEEGEYVIDELIGKRYLYPNGHEQYLIKWKGYPIEEATWQYTNKIPAEVVEAWKKKNEYPYSWILIKDFEQELPTPWLNVHEPNETWWKHR